MQTQTWNKTLDISSDLISLDGLSCKKGCLLTALFSPSPDGKWVLFNSKYVAGCDILMVPLLPPNLG